MSQTPGIDGEGLVGQMLRDGEYHIRRVLGYGGIGKVYLAIHTSLHIPFALKQLQADQPLPGSVIAELDAHLYGGGFIHRSSGGVQTYDLPTSGGPHTDRFLRESLLLARLRHRAIPTLYDYFREHGSWYLVMDYIPGMTLAAYLRRRAPLPPLEALNYTIQICDVLDYLHRQSPPIIFRDLKPANVILTPDGMLMLVDFGTACYFQAGQNNDKLDFGSPGYASPEQYQSKGSIDGRSDLFSLGMMLHEMTSGQCPATPGRKLDSLRSLNPAISTALGGLVALATRSDPQSRFQSAHAFYQALEQVYNIEERRAYQRDVLKVQGREPVSYSREPVEELTDDMPFFPRISLDLEQRGQTRDALLQARKDRLEREDFEQQLACVDEGLQRRSSVPLSSMCAIIEDQQEAPPQTRRAPHRFRHFIQFCFLFTLVLSLVLASLMTYMRSQDHTGVVTQSALVRITPSPITTPSIKATTTPATPASHTLVDSWSSLPSLPSPEADNTATYVQVQGRPYVYVSGGYRGPKQSPFYDRNLYRYDITAAHWEQVTPQSFPGMLNNAAAYDGKGDLFFTAGYSTDSYTVSPFLYLYQPAGNMLRKIALPPQITLGFGMGMVIDRQGHLYITQGFMQPGVPQAAAGTGWYRYDIATDQWHTLAPLPQALGYVILALADDGSILLQGGAADEAQQMPSNRIYRYDVTHNIWRRVHAVLPRPISGAASCQMGEGQLIVIGGYDATTHTGLNTAWLVDLPTLHWLSLRYLPVGGSVLGAAACDDAGHVYLARGGSDPGHPTSDFWQLRVP